MKKINGLSIGVTSQIDGTSLSLTASAAGLSGNSITANSGSSGTFNNAVTLSGGTEISTVGNSFRLFTHGDGVIENSTGPEEVHASSLFQAAENEDEGVLSLLH